MTNNIYGTNIWKVKMVDDTKSFLVVSIPSMLMFGMRHAFDVDHITAIDNLVRLHNKKNLDGLVLDSGPTIWYLY